MLKNLDWADTVGFVGQGFFFLRFFIQWIVSEKLKRSHVPDSFWTLSVIGSILILFKAAVEVWPDVKLPQYKGIKIKKTEPKPVTNNDVTEVIRRLRERSATFVPEPPRALKEHDYAQLTYTEELDGKKTEIENKLIHVAKEAFIPGFVKEIIGMKVGEKKDFSITLPSNFAQKELQEKTISYSVTLNELKRKALPELDDEFVTSTTQAKTVDELKSNILKTIEAEERMAARQKEEAQIIEHLLKNADFEVPQSLVEQQAQYNIQSTVRSGVMRGVPLQTIQEQKDEIFKNATASSVNQIKLGLIIHAIVDKEKIEVSDEEVQRHIENIARIEKTDPASLKKRYDEEGITDHIRDELERRKVMEFLLSNTDRK